MKFYYSSKKKKKKKACKTLTIQWWSGSPFGKWVKDVRHLMLISFIIPSYLINETFFFSKFIF
jgi:hypothetical protein